MHFLHRIVVKASDEESAVAEATDALEPFAGKVYDYFSVGGRWNGHFQGKNVISCEADLPQFKAQMAEVYEGQNAELLRIQRSITRRLYTPADVPNHITSPMEKVSEVNGYVTPASQAWLDRMNQDVEREHEEMKSLLNLKSIREATHGAGMGEYHLRMYLSLATGRYIDSSHFYDAPEESASPVRLLVLLEGADGAGPLDCDLEGLWMVAMDLHN